MNPSQFGLLAALGLAGLALGAASLAGLRATTELYVGGKVWAPIALHLARLAVVGSVLVACAHLGAGPLIAMALGLVLARPLVMRVLGPAR